MADDEARTLAERLLAAALPQRWQHVQAVAAEAARLSAELNVDCCAVVSAAWLHDIGYAPAVAETGFHPLDGARYLRKHGWDEEVCRLVAHHTDAASHADAEGLGEELRTEFAELGGLQQDIVWAADATTGPNGERCTLVERIAEIHQRYGARHPVAERMTASQDALEAAISRVTGASH